MSKASFTPKSINNGGSLGREEATGRGGATALVELLRLNSHLPSDQLSMAVQGYGNVGAYFALIAEREQPSWHLVAATDSKGGIVSTIPLSAKALQTLKIKGDNFSQYNLTSAQTITNDNLISQPVDVLVLAALEDTITNKNMHLVRAKIILELANGSISLVANDYLTKRGIIILPDIIANAGGVIVSYLEWLQNKHAQHWSEKKVNMELHKYMVKAVKATYDYNHQHGISLKEAAFTLALQRIESVNKE